MKKLLLLLSTIVAITCHAGAVDDLNATAEKYGLKYLGVVDHYDKDMPFGKGFYLFTDPSGYLAILIPSDIPSEMANACFQAAIVSAAVTGKRQAERDSKANSTQSPKTNI